MKAAVIGGTGGQGIALTFKEPENRDINIYPEGRTRTKKASGEIRTRDLVLTKDALYRLSH